MSIRERSLHSYGTDAVSFASTGLLTEDQTKHVQKDETLTFCSLLARWSPLSWPNLVPFCLTVYRCKSANDVPRSGKGMAQPVELLFWHYWVPA